MMSSREVAAPLSFLLELVSLLTGQDQCVMTEPASQIVIEGQHTQD